MAPRLGTRTKQSFRKEHFDQGSSTRFLTRDVGMTKLVTASLTFNAGTSQVSGANGTFANFAVGDDLVIEGTNLNNGFYTTIAIDGVNHAFLQLDPPPKSEGPLSATVRTP